MDKKIIIENFHPLTYKHQLAIIAEYMRIYEKKIPIDKDAYFQIHPDKRIETTKKYPNTVKLGWAEYWVWCRETKTSYVFKLSKKF